MSKPTLIELRDAFHSEINRNPDNIALISNNYANALWQIEVPPSIFEACILELHRRYELALMMRRKNG